MLIWNVLCDLMIDILLNVMDDNLCGLLFVVNLFYNLKIAKATHNQRRYTMSACMEAIKKRLENCGRAAVLVGSVPSSEHGDL